MNKKQGFTLIELIIFIIVVGILSASILSSFNTVLRGAARINYQTAATGYAVKCLEWLLGQRSLKGFANVSIGTNVPSFCNVPNNYTISTNVSYSTYNGDSTNYKLISVTVGGDLGGATISSIITNY